MSSAYALCATLDAGWPARSRPAEIDAKRFGTDTALAAPAGPDSKALARPEASASQRSARRIHHLRKHPALPADRQQRSRRPCLS